MKDYAKELAAIEVVDDQATPVTIGSAWQDQPALLVFIRHFG
jgi:hypothetical protein